MAYEVQQVVINLLKVQLMSILVKISFHLQQNTSKEKCPLYSSLNR